MLTRRILTPTISLDVDTNHANTKMPTNNSKATCDEKGGGKNENDSRMKMLMLMPEPYRLYVTS